MVGIIWKSFDSMDGENATGWASVKPCYRGENWQRCNAYGVRIVRQGTNWWPCALRCAWNDPSRPSRPSRCRSQTFSNHLGPSQTFFITFIVLLTDNWWPRVLQKLELDCIPCSLSFLSHLPKSSKFYETYGNIMETYGDLLADCVPLSQIQL